MARSPTIGRPPIDPAGAGQTVRVYLTPGAMADLARLRRILRARAGARSLPGPSATVRAALAAAARRGRAT